MKILFSILLIGFLIILAVKKNTKNNENTNYTNYINSYIPGAINFLPCEQKAILSPDEYNFYIQLRNYCNPEIIQIMPKVKLSSFIRIKQNEINDQYTQKYMSWLPYLDIDFVLTDVKLNILAVIIIETQENKLLQADIIKSAGIALHSINAKADYSKDIKILLEHYIPIATQNNKIH